MGAAKAVIPLFSGLLLAIESSCDETSVAVLRGRDVLANIVLSQIDMHQKWGGVVPEAAARAHVEGMLPTLVEALEAAGVQLAQIEGIAVSNRPGLVGSLSVGVTCAKMLAFSLGVPMIGVHHLEGHLLSSFLHPELTPTFPHIALVVSGGHTELVQVTGPGAYTILGETIDDAAGEAFDKGARLMGLGYPGGRAIQDAAVSGNPKRYSLPQGLSKDPFNFSFSGLKTAVLRLVEKEGDALSVPDAAASLQAAIVGALTKKTAHALDELPDVKCLTLVGGVAANQALRNSLQELCTQRGLAFIAPPMEFCTDNAAMIGVAGSVRLALGERSGPELDCFPNADLPTPPMPHHYLHLTTPLGEIAREAGQIALSIRGSHDTQLKQDGSIVTRADREIEKFLREKLPLLVPGTTVWGEEEGTASPGPNGLWLVDPVDGTSNYAYGSPLWGVSIALYHDGQVQLGAIMLPDLQELYLASRGGGATLNGKALPPIAPGPIRRQELVSYCDDCLRAFGGQLPGKMRYNGAFVVEAAFVAQGVFRAMISHKANFYDAAAAILIVEELGGEVRHADGTQIDYQRVVAEFSMGAPFVLVPKESGLILR